MSALRQNDVSRLTELPRVKSDVSGLHVSVIGLNRGVFILITKLVGTGTHLSAYVGDLAGGG